MLACVCSINCSWARVFVCLLIISDHKSRTLIPVERDRHKVRGHRVRVCGGQSSRIMVSAGGVLWSDLWEWSRPGELGGRNYVMWRLLRVRDRPSAEYLWRKFSHLSKIGFRIGLVWPEYYFGFGLEIMKRSHTDLVQHEPLRASVTNDVWSDLSSRRNVWQLQSRSLSNVLLLFLLTSSFFSFLGSIVIRCFVCFQICVILCYIMLCYVMV